MKYIRRYTLFSVLVVVLLFSYHEFVECRDTGTSGALYISQPVGAISIAIGEACTSVDGQLYCLYYNPAGMASLDGSEICFYHFTGIMDDTSGSVAFGFKKFGGIVALSYVYYTIGDIELTDLSDYTRTVKAEEDNSMMISYSRYLGENLSFGLNIKRLSSTLVEEFNAISMALDFGILFKSNRINWGLAIQNIGQDLTYKENSDPLPQTIRTGISYITNTITIYGDVIKLNSDTNFKPVIGMEYLVNNYLAIRAGLKIEEPPSALTFGLGFYQNKFQLDYGMAILHEIYQNHVVSFSFKF
jgi:uncharacterized protein YbaA (DUF1428 family)